MFALSNKQTTAKQEFRQWGCRTGRCQTHLGRKFAEVKKGNLTLSLQFKRCPKVYVNWGILKSGWNFGTQPCASKLRFNWIYLAARQNWNWLVWRSCRPWRPCSLSQVQGTLCSSSLSPEGLRKMNGVGVWSDAQTDFFDAQTTHWLPVFGHRNSESVAVRI